MKNLTEFYTNKEWPDLLNVSKSEVDDILYKILRAGVKEVWVSKADMVALAMFVKTKVNQEKYNTDELFLRGEVKEVYGIKIHKNYEENQLQEKQKVNEAR